LGGTLLFIFAEWRAKKGVEHYEMTNGGIDLETKFPFFDSSVGEGIRNG